MYLGYNPIQINHEAIYSFKDLSVPNLWSLKVIVSIRAKYFFTRFDIDIRDVQDIPPILNLDLTILLYKERVQHQHLDFCRDLRSACSFQVGVHQRQRQDQFV